MWIRNVVIRVDIDKQQEIIRRAANLLGSHIIAHTVTHKGREYAIPTFPLNTDGTHTSLLSLVFTRCFLLGIDPSAENVLIEHIDIECFDDIIAVKPCRRDGRFCNCASNMDFRDITLSWGVGLTIGSVPPNPNVNCIANVSFSNARAHQPIKLVYIKTNPGTQGTGIIRNISYTNIVAQDSLWCKRVLCCGLA